MSKRTTIVAGVVAIVVLFAGGLAFLDRVTSEPSASRQAGPAPRAEPEAPAPQAQPEPGLAPEAPLAAAPPAAGEPSQPPAPTQPPPPRKVDLLTSLNLARTRILECAGALPPVPDEEPGSNRAAAEARRKAPKLNTVLQLDLEMGDQVVRVAGAKVLARGVATDVILECAQLELHGQVLEASSARPGPNLKMRFALDR
ncbi:MAG: hypothetical protein IPQ24_12780 [Anaeromyxobacter sp.]|nr:hypothetical protein [Anaeromyxobacter sp.]